MAAQQLCERKRGQTNCGDHPHKKVTTKCQECGKLVCIDCMTSKEHKGHTFVNFNDSFKQAKENLENRVWRLENKILPELTQNIENSNCALVQRNQDYENKIQSVDELNQQCVEKVNAIFKGYKSQVEQHSKQSKAPLQEHFNTLKSLEEEVLSQITLCKTVVNSGTPVEIHDDESELNKKREIVVPMKPDLNLQTSPPYKHLGDAEQLVQKWIVELEELNSPGEKSVVATAQQEIRSKNNEKSSELYTDATPNHDNNNCLGDTGYGCQLFPCDRVEDPFGGSQLFQLSRYVGYNATVYSQFICADKMFSHKQSKWKSLCPISTTFAWVKEMDGKSITKLHLINTQGHVVYSFKVKGEVVGIVVHPVGGQMYGEFSDKTLRALDHMTGEAREIIQTEQHPHHMTMTCDGHFIVGMASRVEDFKLTIYKFTLLGELVCRSKEKHRTNDISENPKNNHVAISCGKDGLCVLDNSLRNFFRYFGLPGLRLCAYTAVFDARGNIIVGDYWNRNLQIVGGDSGTCIHVLNITDMAHPLEIRLHNSMLWVRCEIPRKFMCVELSH